MFSVLAVYRKVLAGGNNRSRILSRNEIHVGALVNGAAAVVRIQLNGLVENSDQLGNYWS